ncbi:hypothetical protein GT755_27065 [Herbidospora sp. NEAU-GS84]|uniref:Metalloprotease n=1 Tax=Herbidospora solisilvae TaxID=2696284 RepID=A0A7C9NL72_9ACTN|nr:neutral zinc metallopeptidase [Herbidospora solisilvae]NAS25332.1 hypothetical protein [Herbidospora solisilvae]
MRRTLIPGLVLIVALAGLATPAHADPADDPKLIDNALYASGTIPRSTCAEKPIKKRNDPATARAYFATVTACLDRVWTKQLAKAGVKFRKPKLKLLAKDPKSYCGSKWDRWDGIDYCEDNREIMAVLDRTILNLDPDDLWIFTALSNRYAEHVQYLTGIETAMFKILPDEGEPGYEETHRRVYLQAYCLSGVFTASVFKSLPRKTSEWTHIVKAHTEFAHRMVGSAKNITYWMNRGFNSRNPKYCNTWTASNAQVA